MAQVQRRPANRTHAPSIEGMEGRCLMTATTLPDIAMISATTTDSKSVTFDYSIADGPINQPIDFAIYRSVTPEYGPGAIQVADSVTLPAGGTSGGTLDLNGQPANADGNHAMTVAIPGGLPPDPSHPYVVVVADPSGAVNELNKANNSTDFRTYVIGIISHGGIQSVSAYKDGPGWELKMANEMTDEGYDLVIPFNWAADSSHPGAAARQAVRLEKMILKASTDFPADAPVDLDFIGHSEGTVVNSQALLRLDTDGLPENFQAGYIKMTMLDPHAANNAVKGPQYSVGEGILGFIAKETINDYQSKAQDPLVVVPSNVQDAEVFFQHTPAREAGANDGMYNLWGQVPVISTTPVSYFDLTTSGMNHSDVHNWYLRNVVPSLGIGASFITNDTLSGALDTTAPATILPGGRESVTYTGHAAPGATVRLFAGRTDTKVLKRIGVITADANGDWSITSRPIAPGTYRVDAIANAPQGPGDSAMGMRPTAFFGRILIPPLNAKDKTTT